MAFNNSKTPDKLHYNPNESDSTDSEWGLEIVIKSTPKKRKKQSIDPKDKEIIEEFEKDIEETLEEKAAKSNLSHTTVKSILKHVFTDEHVLALVKQKEGCEDVEGIIPYEPKITRSKAKQLYSNSGSVIPLPWRTPIPTSEVHALLTEDLQEDSSGDEYIPGDEESEDDTSISCSASNPPTPVVLPTTPNQSFTEEGVFKTPQPKKKRDEMQLEEDENNIALRTRSKFSLSQTPLEQIEQAFIPPDITTDMYEMDCKDDDWKEFLNSFTKPLEDVVKGTEDEDHDPEYNVLSDEEINTVDKEELRADKAVKVPRKELNDLMAELFEYVDIYSKKTEKEKNDLENSLAPNCQIMSCSDIISASVIDVTSSFCQNSSSEYQGDWIKMQGQTEYQQNQCFNDVFSESQLLLLQQQIRQHVQILTQNFLLTYNHQFYAGLAEKMKEYLLNFKFLSEGKGNSIFMSTNLESALNLIDKWEKFFKDNEKEAEEIMEHFEKVMKDSLELHLRGQYYHLPFPSSILKTISDSDVFIYPYLLPQIPFKHPEIVKNDLSSFSNSEYQLVASGLEQFVPHFQNEKEFITRTKQLNMKKIAELISFVIMPARSPSQIYRQIIDKKKENNLPNPITYYHLHKKAPITFHQVNPLIHFKTVPPRRRPPELLPVQWRNYIWPNWKKNGNNDLNEQYRPKPALIYTHPRREQPSQVLRKILPKERSNNDKKRCDGIQETKLNCSVPKVRNLRSIKGKFMKCFRATVSYSKYYSLRQKIRFFTEENEEYKNILKEDINDPLEMLPSMPSLNLIETSNNVSTIQPKSEDIGEENENTKDEVKNNLQDSELLDSTGSKEFKSSIENVNKNLNSEFLEMIDADKDNVEEINAFMVASSTVKSVREKKELLSLSDKKKAKKRKEYLASIAMLTPPDPTLEKDRREQFAQAYLEKLKETLEPNDYRKVEILCEDTDEKTGNAVDLYKKLRPILSPKYKDLADEFLLFLNAEQANAVGKLIPFFILNHMVKFLRNLEIYFKDQPSQLKKIYKSLLEFNDGTNASLDKVKSTILPLLRGNPLLCDCFLQIFIEESPTATLLNGTWEIIDVNKELCRPEDEAAFESVTISDSEDSACACSCHKIDEQQPLKQHCVNCGLRFMHGKVYCQTGKGFKRVQITFPFNPDVDHIARLGVQNRTKRIEHSPSKRLNSPIKEPQDENRICNDSEDDDKRKNVKACKSPKKTKPKPKKDTPAKSSRKESPKKNIEKSSNKSNPCRRKRTKSIKLNDSVNRKIINDEDKVDSEFLSKPGNSSGQIKRLVNGIDWKNLPSPEYLDIHSSDSELSQDDSTKHHLPSKECYIKDKTSCENWTREEDKIILETFQQKFDQDAIQLIAKRLKKRRVDEIRTRFERLMALLQEMETS